MKARPSPRLLTAALKAEEKFRRADATRERMRQARNEAVDAALVGGYSQREVADELGLSAGRIGQMRMVPKYPKPNHQEDTG